MSVEKDISTMADIAALSKEEFDRFLPDFLIWREAVQMIKANNPDHQGAYSSGMVWSDDGVNKITGMVTSK